MCWELTESWGRVSCADHTRSQPLAVCARTRVCVRLCVCVRESAQPQGHGGARAAGFFAAASGARVPGGADPGRAQTRARPALCVSVRLRAAAGTIFCSAPDRHIKGKAAAAGRRPLSLRCPLLQVYYYSTGRAASPRGPGQPPGCAAPWPPSRLARPQTASSASLFV